MNTELICLATLSVFFFCAWVPSSIGKFRTLGGVYLLSNRDKKILQELPAWAARSERAYENLKAFYPAYAAAILILCQLKFSDEATRMCAIVYVVGRIGHFICYTYGFPKGRAIMWLTSMIANVVLFVKIFAYFI